MVGEGIGGVNGSSKTSRSKDLAQLCAKGWQMVMVIKVFKLVVKLMVVEPSRNVDIMKIPMSCGQVSGY